MVDFASSILDHGITVQTTENVNESKQKVVIGSFKGIKGGQPTESSFNEHNDTFKEYSKGSKGQTTIEPGIFFREFKLRPRTVMQMLNIVDKMPWRSFLPRVNPLKLLFSTQRLREVKELFAVQEGSATEHVILNALCECKRPPSPGEMK
ncbi:polygalacturonase 1 beta-like protein 3 [Eucalyptus grandis]|uniref:polygalacturonase 1 beta-like protein 3 n=1 Tax=Eucalyptus grandis TaxID=71139 RepID=UPI00192E8E49|nr:polygalacturonase 1 beta-like protein 3 [Eucalyptus grandis]